MRSAILATTVARRWAILPVLALLAIYGGWQAVWSAAAEDVSAKAASAPTGPRGTAGADLPIPSAVAPASPPRPAPLPAKATGTGQVSAPAPAPSAASATLPPAAAQPADATAAARLEEAGQLAKKLLETPKPQPEETPLDTRPPTLEDVPRIDLLAMARRGGPLMIPIAAFSVLVVALSAERALALRRRKVLPRELVAAVTGRMSQEEGLRPREVYYLCLQFPSALANVISAVLARLHRPPSEIERALGEASQREAQRLSGNVRWLSLSAAVAPMFGLLGTVQGMIMAFYRTAHMPVGANKAQFLAESIYIALVTTFAGLSVAIPAAILAHLFNGRIIKLFQEMEEPLGVLLSQLERFQREHPEEAEEGQAEAQSSPSILAEELLERQRPAAKRK